MISRFIIVLSLLGLAAGCASPGSTYGFVAREPVPGIYYIEIQWRERRWEVPDWQERAAATAKEVIEEEMRRLGLPHSTVYVGQPTPYGSTWVSVFAMTSDLPEAEMRDHIAKFEKTKAVGQRPPPAIYRFRGEFRNKEPNSERSAAP